MLGTYVALVYSIGIGENRRLVIADWRSLMEDLGFQNPRTLIATGNAIFESRGATVRKLEIRLEDAFEHRFGRRVDTILRAAASFRQLAVANPFPSESQRDGSHVVVRIMRKPIDSDSVVALIPYLTQGERLTIVEGDLWVHFKRGAQPIQADAVLGVQAPGDWNGSQLEYDPPAH